MRLRTQQLMIEFADVLDRLLQPLIIVEPAPNLSDALATHAALLHPPPDTADRQHTPPVPPAARPFREVFGVPDGALQQRAAKHLTAYRQFADELVARPNGPIANHSLE